MKGKKNKDGTFTITVSKREMDGLCYITLGQHCTAFVQDFGTDEFTPAPYGLVNKKNVENVVFGLEEGLRNVKYPDDQNFQYRTNH